MNNDTINVDISKKWRLLLWKVFLSAAIMFMVVEVIICLVKKDLGMTRGAYMGLYVAIPLVIYAGVLSGTVYVLKKNKLTENGADWLVSMMMFVIFIVPAFEHYNAIVLALLPMVSIVITAVFANQNITLVMTLLTFCSLIINDIRLYSLFEWKEISFGAYVTASFGLVLVLSVVTFLLNMHTKELMESIGNFTVRQMNLMTELRKDPLTGLYNRRSFEESLEKEIQRTEETGEKAYIAIFDIDHFKNVNDTYGHSNGDVVIKALCKMLKEKAKDYGLAFRYGGEEFVILFNNIELPKVINVVEDVRTEFRCYYFQFMNNSGITCSCGVAEYSKGESAKAWFNRADNSLYQAKEAGRNRTVVSE